MIDKVLVLTLERCVERQHVWLGASQMQGIPLERISFVKAHDDKDYEDMTAVAVAAKEDGFDFVEEYAIGTVTEYVQQTAASVCQVWNFARIFRHIAESGEVCLVLTDDKMITINFDIMNVLMTELLLSESEEFYIFQLVQRGDLNEIEFREHDRFERHKVSNFIFGAIFHQTIPSYKDFFLKPGLAGYDESMVLSPEGADWILGCLDRADDFYIFFDHFIHNRLTDEAAGAVAQNKGIYCPRESGFIFVEEIMAMGTTTNWAPEDSHHFEGANQKTEVSWAKIR